MTPERLEAVLASLAGDLEVVVDVDDAVPASSLGAPSRPFSGPGLRLAIAAAIAVVFATAGLVIAPGRDAIADWLGLGSTAIGRLDPDQDLPDGVPIDEGLRPLTLDEAERRIGSLARLSTSELGAPHELAAMPEGGVLLGWPRGATTLWVHRDGEPPIDLLVKKLVDTRQIVREVDGIGDAALLIVGDHVLLTPNRTISAGTVLLWVDGDVERRLESDLPADEMIAIAQQMEDPPPP